MDPVVFFSSPPVLEDLCAVTVRVKKSSQYRSTIQTHILRCREFIFSESNIIASPSFDLDGCFNVIMQISLCKRGRLQGRMQKLDLEFSKPFRVHPTLYQSCLRYTLTARLAPSWNKAGEWHIQGRDFVTHKGYANAVKVSICVNKDEIFASLCGTMLRSPPLQVEDLNLSCQEMLNILKSTQGAGRQVELQDCWCHVLPSMKKGRILSVSLLMPLESPFSGYSELKRHWKNTHGYRLPDTDEDILYCQVSFFPSGIGKQFTYPDICLRNQPAQSLSRVDCKPILSSFIQDVHARVGTVCGQPLRFTPKMHFTSLELHEADEEVSLASLSRKRNNNSISRRPPLRSSQNVMEVMKLKTFTQDQSSSQTKLIKQIGVCPNDLLSDVNGKIFSKNMDSDIGDQCKNHDKPNSITNEKCLNEGQGVNAAMKMKSSQEKNFNWNSSHGSNVNGKSILKTNQAITSNKVTVTANFDMSPNKIIQPSEENFEIQQPAEPSSKLIPIFHSQKKYSSNINTDSRKDVNEQSSKFIPVFKSKQQSSSSMSVVKAIASSKSKTTALTSVTIPSSQPNTTQIPLFPVFRPKSKPPVIKHVDNIKSNIVKPGKSLSIPLANSSKLSQQKSIDTPSISGHEVSTFSMKELQLPTDSSLSHWKGKAVILPSMTSTLSHTSLSPGFCSKSVPKDVISGKRKKQLSKQEPGTPTTKKPRPKPQLQNLDVDALARSNQLNKANFATLTMWLKDRGVVFKSKDKKPDLIEKVKVHLNISISEP